MLIIRVMATHGRGENVSLQTASVHYCHAKAGFYFQTFLPLPLPLPPLLPNHVNSLAHSVLHKAAVKPITICWQCVMIIILAGLSHVSSY